jgi:hypothetical protein
VAHRTDRLLSRPRLAVVTAPWAALGVIRVAVAPTDPAGYLVTAFALIFWAALEKAINP